MKTAGLRRLTAGGAILVVACSIGAVAQTEETGGGQVIATVNGEPITAAQMLRQVDSFHQDMQEPSSKVRRPDPTALLDRIINVRLILQEARRIGLDELPEMVRQLESIRLDVLKSELVKREVGDITAGDPEVEEQIYRDTVRQMEVDSLLFSTQEDADAFATAIAADGDFNNRSAEAIAAGKAQGAEGTRSIKASELRPEAARILAGMEPGAVSAPIRMAGGFAVIKLHAIRYPEDPEARKMARQAALRLKKERRLQDLMERWRKEYTKIDRERLASLDYHAPEPGLEALQADERIIARVKGAEPVRVKELTREVEKNAFHGIARAIEMKRVNRQLEGVLDHILLRRVAMLEGERLGIIRSPAYEEAVERRFEQVLFSTFMKRVVNPDVKMRESEVRKYYEEHIDDYTSPSMIRIESLAFRRREDAESALDKLKRGADLAWMRAHADGQAERREFPSLLALDGQILLTGSLPEGVRQAVAGAAPGDLRSYVEPDGPAYVLVVREKIGGTPRPYEEVRSEAAGEVYETKRAAVVEEWAAKLRAASEIEILVSQEELKAILGLGFAQGA